MTAAEAITALLPILGTGGLTTIIVAVVGYKAQKAKGTAVLKEAIGLGPLKSADLEVAVQAITTLSGAVMRLSLIQEFDLGDRREDFEEWVNAREMKATLDAFKAEQRSRLKAPPERPSA